MPKLMILLGWTVLFFGIGCLAIYLGYRLRGGFRYWTRLAQQPQMQVLGRWVNFAGGQEEITAALVDANALLRSRDQRSSLSVRIYEPAKKRVFVGVALEQGGIELDEGFEIYEVPEGAVVRVSGSNRSDESTPLEAAQGYLGEGEISADAPFIELRGQSFSLLQWKAKGVTEPLGRWSRWGERIYQLRDNLWLTIIGTIIAIGLLGTRSGVWFAIGVGLIVFLSGACKFVFIHQRTDEAEEVHLQNY